MGNGMSWHVFWADSDNRGRAEIFLLQAITPFVREVYHYKIPQIEE